MRLLVAALILLVPVCAAAQFSDTTGAGAPGTAVDGASNNSKVTHPYRRGVDKVHGRPVPSVLTAPKRPASQR